MKFKKLQSIFIFPLVLIAFPYSITSAQEKTNMRHSYMPKDGYIANKIMAIKIADIVLVSIYGEESIKSQRPLSASLENGVWTVVGTINTKGHGGVAEIDISKTTGQILRVTHGK